MAEDGATGLGPAAGRGAVLVVEDEALVAFDVEDMLRDLGFADVVVCNGYDAAEAALNARDFPFAVFDLNLDGRLSVPLVEHALARGTHVVVASGYEPEVVPLDAAPTARVLKPVQAAQLARALGMRAATG